MPRFSTGPSRRVGDNPPGKAFASALLLLALAGCDAIPQDTEGTLERIRQERVLRAGIVAGTADAAPAQRLVGRLADGWGARVDWREGPATRLLDELEKGEVDLVIGEWAKASPLVADVSFSQPVGRPEPDDSRQPALRLARRHGENRLVTATDRLVMP